ncbi:MAG: hypothetical protein ABFC56_06560, partial [Clostridiaceae bacterium]
MRLLYDLRAYQYYDKRGIGRYICELFTRVMQTTEGSIYALVEEPLDKPVLPDDLAERVCFRSVEQFLTDEFPDDYFDCFINGAALQLAHNGGPLEWMYPPQVLR